MQDNPVVSKLMASLPAIGHSITGLFILFVAGAQSNPDLAATYGFPAGIVAILGQVVAYVSSQKNQKDTEKAKVSAEGSLAIPPDSIDTIPHNLALIQGMAASMKNSELVSKLNEAMNVCASRKAGA